MALGQKYKFTGTIERQIVAKGSKSEHEAIVLVPDGTAHPVLQIRIQGGNPFYDPSLEPFVGKRVTFDGVPGSGAPFVLVDSVSDITVITPPNKKPKHKTPKP